MMKSHYEWPVKDIFDKKLIEIKVDQWSEALTLRIVEKVLFSVISPLFILSSVTVNSLIWSTVSSFIDSYSSAANSLLYSNQKILQTFLFREFPCTWKLIVRPAWHFDHFGVAAIACQNSARKSSRVLITPYHAYDIIYWMPTYLHSSRSFNWSTNRSNWLSKFLMSLSLALALGFAAITVDIGWCFVFDIYDYSRRNRLRLHKQLNSICLLKNQHWTEVSMCQNWLGLPEWNSNYFYFLSISLE